MGDGGLRKKLEKGALRNGIMKREGIVTDVEQKEVIGSLVINYLYFVHKKGSLRNGHNRKKGGGHDKKVVFAAEHTFTGHIYECHPLLSSFLSK